MLDRPALRHPAAPRLEVGDFQCSVVTVIRPPAADMAITTTAPAIEVAAHRRAADRRRQRRCRANAKRGLACAQILVRKKAIAAALVRSGALSEAEAQRWPKVERELAEIVRLWAARWSRTWNA